MAAKDYRICCALYNAYIVDASKVATKIGDLDRRAIESNEILALIDWFLNKELGDDFDIINFGSVLREGYDVVIAYRKKGAV